MLIFELFLLFLCSFFFVDYGYKLITSEWNFLYFIALCISGLAIASILNSFILKIKIFYLNRKEYMEKEYKHVYCTDCVQFPNLEAYIMLLASEIPIACSGCYPYDPEDSRGNDLRVNYVEAENVS